MSFLAKDISRWQGAYTETGEPIVFVKISGGDQGLYIDSQAANNYNQVIAHGHAFGGYHFAGGGDPVAEANFFLNAMKPWNPGEVPCLDWEIQHSDPVGWCLAFANQVHSVAGAWPVIYLNRATLMAFDWSPVLNNCALWLADWTGSPDANIDTGKYTYTIQQYSDGPNYDHDVVYVDSTDQFKKLGWPAPTPPPIPQTPLPVSEPPLPTNTNVAQSTPTPVTPPEPSVLPDLVNKVPTPTNSTGAVPTPSPVATGAASHPSWLARLIKWLERIFQ